MRSDADPSPRRGCLAVGRNNFDVIRIALAALVIVSHAFPLGTGREAGEPLVRLFHHVIFRDATTLGAIAVDGFFILSGFLIAMSWERRRSTFDYFNKRVRRIYPGFLVAVAIGAYLIPYVAIDGHDWTHVPPATFAANAPRLLNVEHPRSFASNIFPLALDSVTALPHPRIGVTNGSLWSISFEFWCYIGVAGLGLTGLLARRAAVTVMFVASLLVAIGVSASGWRPGGGILGQIVGFPVFWARLAPFYLAGVVAYRWRDELRYSDLGMIVAVAGTIATGFVPHAWAAVLPVSLTYMLFWLGHTPRLPHLNVTRFGDWSYGVYLYGFPIQQLVVRAAGGSMAPIALMLVSLPLALMAGAASWLLVERWFVSRKRQATPAVAHDPVPAPKPGPVANFSPTAGSSA